MQPQNIFAQRMGIQPPMGANPPRPIVQGLGPTAPQPTAPIAPYNPVQSPVQAQPIQSTQPVGAMPYHPMDSMMQSPEVQNYLRQRMGM